MCPLSRKMRHIFLKRSGIAPLKVIIVGSAVAAVDPTHFLSQIYHYVSIYSIILKHLSLYSEKEETIITIIFNCRIKQSAGRS